MTFFDVESVKNVILNQNAANRSVLTAVFIKTLTTNVTVVWLAILLRIFWSRLQISACSLALWGRFLWFFSIPPDKPQNNPTDKTSYLTGPGLIPGHSVWDLWWTKLHRERFFTEYFGFPCHLCNIALHLYIDSILVIFVTGSIVN
jgi:hypothetical protein